jgi:hypothetical protein
VYISSLTPFLNPDNFPGLGGIYGAILSSAVALCVAVGVARVFTGRVKRIEATLEFSKRYHSLLEQHHSLNNSFYYDADGNINNNPVRTARQEGDSWALFFQLFDLLLHEFNFFRQGFVERHAFVEWMKWRWYDWDPNRAAAGPGRHFETCGISYRAAWVHWRAVAAVANNPFVSFLNSVHDAHSENAVQPFVKRYAPQTWRTVLGLLAVGTIIVIIITVAIGAAAMGVSSADSPPKNMDDRVLSLAGNKPSVEGLCNIRFWQEAGLLLDTSTAKFDDAAKTVFGIPDLNAQCRTLVHGESQPPTGGGKGQRQQQGRNSARARAQR